MLPTHPVFGRIIREALHGVRKAIYVGKNPNSIFPRTSNSNSGDVLCIDAQGSL